VQGVQRRVAIVQVLWVGKAVRPRRQTRLVGNGGPRGLVGETGRERRAHAKGQSVRPGVLQTEQQRASRIVVGQVGVALRAGVFLAGMFVVSGLFAVVHLVRNGNGLGAGFKAGTVCVRQDVNRQGPRRALALWFADGCATDGAFGILLQAALDAVAVKVVSASDELHHGAIASIGELVQTDGALSTIIAKVVGRDRLKRRGKGRGK